MFYYILERKNASLGYKKKSWKSQKIDINPWFWSKNVHFSNLFFGNTGKEKVFHDILEQKKRLSKL